jgi:hypothetical protein
MAATVQLKIYTGASAGTESPVGDAGNWNLMNQDLYDTTGTAYQAAANRITVPAADTAYSYERWMRLKCTGTFNSITNVLFYRSAGSLSDANLDLMAGVTATAATAVNTISGKALSTKEEWDTSGEALDITPAAGEITTATTYSKYAVVQLVAPSTVTTPGDIGSQTITFSYDES